MALSQNQIQHLKTYSSVLVTTFFGGALSYFTAAQSAGVPETFQWKIAIVGAVTAGAAALRHLFQTVPGDAPEAVIGQLLTADGITSIAGTISKEVK